MTFVNICSYKDITRRKVFDWCPQRRQYCTQQRPLWNRGHMKNIRKRTTIGINHFLVIWLDEWYRMDRKLLITPIIDCFINYTARRLMVICDGEYKVSLKQQSADKARSTTLNWLKILLKQHSLNKAQPVTLESPQLSLSVPELIHTLTYAKPDCVEKLILYERVIKRSVCI